MRFSPTFHFQFLILTIHHSHLIFIITDKSDGEESPIFSVSAPELTTTITFPNRAHSSAISMSKRSSPMSPLLGSFDSNNNNNLPIHIRGPGVVVSSFGDHMSANQNIASGPTNTLGRPFISNSSTNTGNIPASQISISPSLHHHHNSTFNPFELHPTSGLFNFSAINNCNDQTRSNRGRNPNYYPVNLALLCPFLEHMPNGRSIDSLINSIDGSNGLMDVNGALDFEVCINLIVCFFLLFSLNLTAKISNLKFHSKSQRVANASLNTPTNCSIKN